MSAETYVIVGAGQAGHWAAMTLRAEGFAGRVVLVGEEPHRPYERPPLSKAVLAGKAEPGVAFFNAAEAYEARGIELHLGTRVQAIDPAARRVSLAGGGDLSYDKLLLATGSRVRRIPVPGAELANIFYLRGLDDCLAIQSRLTPGARLVVVGGGYIGLEAAATARGRKCQVTVIEVQDQVLARVAAPELGQFFAAAHRDSGVDIRCGLGVAGFEGAGRVERVRCADGTALEADLVVVGIGVAPGTELAEASGLAVDNGILVDEAGRSSDPHIFAAGDVSNHPNPLLGRRVRLESWQNAQNQAIATATAMCGQEVAYAEVPWFWSDQYDLNLQMLGLPETWDRAIQRGEMGARSFTMFYLSQGRLVAASAVNSAKDIAVARRLIQSAKPVDAAALANPEVRLKTLL